MRRTISVHVKDPRSAEGFLLVLWKPDAEGRVRCREWTSDDWLAPGRDDERKAADVRARLRACEQEGWLFSEPMARIWAWLDER